jgi:hypothetical protein
MSRQVKIVLPDPAAAQLEELAAAAGEPLATLARRFVREGITAAASDGAVDTHGPLPPQARGTSGRPPWLEPYGGSRAWRAETWGAIVALHGRYPRQLQHLKHGWWTDHSQTETLSALAAWRAEIDDTGQDPREELAFHAQLADYSHALLQEGGGITTAWKPGAPPDEWTDAT